MPKPSEDRQFDSRQPLYQRYLADVRALVARRSAVAKGEPPGDIDDLVESNLFYVFQVAWDYRNLGIPLEDLLSEGNVGLIEAAHRFDRDRGVKFITYATWWIRKRILNHVARQIGIVRLPKYKSERLRRLRIEEKRLVGSSAARRASRLQLNDASFSFEPESSGALPAPRSSRRPPASPRTSSRSSGCSDGRSSRSSRRWATRAP